MVQYNDNEVSNEAARVVRGRLTVDREGGLLNTVESYGQLKEIASLALVLNPDSIYYVGKIANNQLLSLVRQEIGLVEDMLAALEFIPRIGKPIVNTTPLSNAITSLLNVEASGSVTNRPELSIFTRNIDQFLGSFRDNVVTPDNNLARPRDEARELLRQNLALLTDLHEQVLSKSALLRDLVRNYKVLDIPTKSASTMFENIRSVLQQLQQDIERSDDSTNIARSRIIALKGLTARALVNLVLKFRDIESLKYRSPINPIPSGLAYYGRVRGTGDRPAITTAPGPWKLPLPGDLQLKVDGGSVQTVDLSGIVGGTLNGRNAESFSIGTGNRFVHALMDRTVDVYGGFAGPITVNTIRVAPLRWMGFRHLGTVLQFPGMSGPDQYPRVLTYLSSVVTGGMPFSWNPATQVISIPGSGAFQPSHVGFTFRTSTAQLFEIARYIDPDNAELDSRGLTPLSGGMWAISGVTGLEAAVTLTFSPALSVSPIAPVTVGPTYRAASITAGSRTAAQVVLDLNQEAPAGLLNPYGSLVWGVQALVSPADSSKVSLRTRNRVDPSITIAMSSLNINSTSPALPSVLEDSAHDVLGFRVGEQERDAFMTPAELVNAIVGNTVGLQAAVQQSTIASGTATTTIGTGAVALPFNPQAMGVVAGHQIELTDGPDSGLYVIDSVGISNVSVYGHAFLSSTDVLFRILADVVEISSASAGPGSSVEVVSSPAALGLSTGITYGNMWEFEATTKRGELLSFDLVTAGDSLRVTGFGTVEIEEAAGTTLMLAQSLPSNVSSSPFEITGSSDLQFRTLSSGIETVLSSPNLMANHQFDKSLDALDAALTFAMIPGQSFSSNLSRARQFLADLLAALTTSPLRTSEYSVTIPDYGTSLEDVLLPYSAAPTDEINNLLDSLVERKYDRAYDLLSSGDLGSFYETTEETASYAGTLLASVRTVSEDLPKDTKNEYNVNLSYDLPVTIRDVDNALDNFSDVAFDGENY